MYLVNKELVKKLMYITVSRLEENSITEEETNYLQNIIDIINQMEEVK